MRHRGFRFEFDVPDDWEANRDGPRFVFHGRAGEELIVSGAILEGSGAPQQITATHDALVKNVMTAMSAAADHPDLVTVKPLREDEGAVARPLRSWTVHSQSRSGDVQFSQAAISDGMSVLLVTFEAPNVPDCLSVYRQLLKGIRPAASH
jgi:hypothetical protein